MTSGSRQLLTSDTGHSRIGCWGKLAALALIVAISGCANAPEAADGSLTLEEAEARAAAGDYTALGEYYEAQEAQEALERNRETEEFTCPRGTIAVCARVSQFNPFEHCECAEEQF